MEVDILAVGRQCQGSNSRLLCPQSFTSGSFKRHYDTWFFIPEELLIHFRLISNAAIGRSIVSQLCFTFSDNDEEETIRVNDLLCRISPFVSPQLFPSSRVHRNRRRFKSERCVNFISRRNESS